MIWLRNGCPEVVLYVTTILSYRSPKVEILEKKVLTTMTTSTTIKWLMGCGSMYVRR